VTDGLAKVDQLLARRKRPRVAQAALIAIDPRTGEILAMVGGRSYTLSQFNRAVHANRQPGSVFKPFVYAAAMDTAIEGGSHILTAGTTIEDEPTTFWFDNKPYEPSNFEHKFYGPVTLRRALARSLNVATVKVAEMVGYDRVVEMASRAGLNNQQPTPAVALGAYEVTPIEIAGAYTLFANQGVYVKPTFINMVRAENGESIYANKVEKHQALDTRIAYLMTNLMEEVMRSGTAAGVRGRSGFNAPAAGKTGTSHDGWFAGYTTELLCVVWVGFDDNRELELEGAHSAAPIWGEFMKRALHYRDYSATKPFTVPDGIVTVQIDPLSGTPATPMCPETTAEVYIAGTQPVGSCPLHGAGQPGMTNVAGWDNSRPVETAPVTTAPRISGAESPVAAQRRGAPPAQAPSAVVQAEKRPEEQKDHKKGFFRRLWGVFK